MICWGHAKAACLPVAETESRTLFGDRIAWLGREPALGSPGKPKESGGEVQSHKFSIGQNVVMKQNAVHRAPTDTFEIVRLLPAERDNPQYRIRSLRDGHERMVVESDLA